MTNGTITQEDDPIFKYQALDTILGEGANSKVYLGRNINTSDDVALKITDYSVLGVDSVRQLENEIKILKKLSQIDENNDFLHLYDVIEQDEEVCLATEYIPGGDLSDYCDQFPNGVPERIGKWSFLKLLKATDRLHKNNICHRDLKLENIMYNKETHKLKLIDFGFATETVETKDGVEVPKLQKDYCGSVHYAAPEIVQRKPYDGKKADVWSLGIILFVLLSGLFPFDDAQNRPEVIFDKIVAGDFFTPSYLSSDAAPLIRSMLHKDPNKRPSVSKLLKHPWFTHQR